MELSKESIYKKDLSRYQELNQSISKNLHKLIDNPENEQVLIEVPYDFDVDELDGLELDLENEEPVAIELQNDDLVKLSCVEDGISSYMKEQIIPFFPVKGVDNKTIYKPKRKIDRIFQLRKATKKHKINKKAIVATKTMGF